MTTLLLFLNDIGTSELIFAMLVVLLLFGAKNIPSIAKTMGRGMREIRQASDEIKQDITESVTEMRKNLNMNDSIEQIKKPLTEIKKSILEPSSKKKKLKKTTNTSAEFNKKTE